MKALEHRLRGWRKAARLSWERWRYSFGTTELLAALRRAGVSSGDTIMVHSALDRFGAFQGSPTGIIETLEEAVGPRGAVLMPTIPFSGTALEYVQSGVVFDVARTPSRVGLLTELFRRSKGVIRSLHPTHSVAVWGLNAEQLAADHARADTPCGPLSPYDRLLECDGKIVLLGVPIDVLTFFHTIEACLEDAMPSSPFTRETFEVPCRDAHGEMRIVRTRLFDPAMSRRRTMKPLVPELKRSGVWKETRVGNVTLVVIPARGTMEAAQRLAQRGVYCYEGLGGQDLNAGHGQLV